MPALSSLLLMLLATSVFAIRYMAVEKYLWKKKFPQP
jgi:hypothetical protein